MVACMRHMMEHFLLTGAEELIRTCRVLQSIPLAAARRRGHAAVYPFACLPTRRACMRACIHACLREICIVDGFPWPISPGSEGVASPTSPDLETPGPAWAAAHRRPTRRGNGSCMSRRPVAPCFERVRRPRASHDAPGWWGLVLSSIILGVNRRRNHASETGAL